MREDIAYLNGNKLALLRAGVYTAEALVAEEARLNLEHDTLGSEDRDSDFSIQETIAEARTLSELLKDIAQLYLLSSPREKEPVIAAIFSELTINGDTLEYKCKNGFQALASRFIASGDPTGWLSELGSQHPYILAGIDILKTTLAAIEQPANVYELPVRRSRDTDDDMSEQLAA